MIHVDLEAEVKLANPFNAEHLEKLEAIERKLEVLNELARRAELCGVRCETQLATARAIQRSLLAIKREFLADFITDRDGP